MADSEITKASAPPPPVDQHSMETQTQQPQDPQTVTQQEPKTQTNANLTLRIWPPTQRTRDAVIARLIETFTAPSVLSKRYGSLPSEEASSAASRIEQEAFAVAESASSAEDDGIEILQVYSKEISKRMLDTVKSRANASVPDSGSAVGTNENGTAGKESVASTVQSEA